MWNWILLTGKISRKLLPTIDNVVNILELSCHLLWWWTLNMETYDSMIWVMTSKRGARSAAAHNKLDCPTTTKNEVVMVWLSNWLKFGYNLKTFWHCSAKFKVFSVFEKLEGKAWEKILAMHSIHFSAINISETQNSVFYPTK